MTPAGLHRSPGWVPSVYHQVWPPSVDTARGSRRLCHIGVRMVQLWSIHSAGSPVIGVRVSWGSSLRRISMPTAADPPLCPYDVNAATAATKLAANAGLSWNVPARTSSSRACSTRVGGGAVDHRETDSSAPGIAGSADWTSVMVYLVAGSRVSGIDRDVG